jgi:hypothetical protein
VVYLLGTGRQGDNPLGREGFMIAARLDRNSESTWDGKPCAAHLRYAAIFRGQGQGSSRGILGSLLCHSSFRKRSRRACLSHVWGVGNQMFQIGITTWAMRWLCLPEPGSARTRKYVTSSRFHTMTSLKMVGECHIRIYLVVQLFAY